MPDNRTSFLTATLAGGGEPQTKEEEAFVLDYMEKYGVAPTGAEVAMNLPGQGEGKFTYLPGSTMGKMGFKNLPEAWNAWNQGESYGPWAGEGYGKEIPMGGIVTTDEQGKPSGRYFQFREGLGARDIAAGRYIMPSGGVDPALEAQLKELFPEGTPMPKGFESEMPGVYPRRGTFTAPDINDPLKFNPTQVYAAKYQDYLNIQTEKDLPLIKGASDRIKQLEKEYNTQKRALDNRLYSKEIDSEQYKGFLYELQTGMEDRYVYWQDIIDNAMTDKKAKSLVAQLQHQLGRGIVPEEIDYTGLGLPIMPSDFKGGGTLASLVQSTSARERKAWEASQPRPFAGYGGNLGGVQPSGNEKQLFSQYVTTLNLAPQYEDWLFQNYGNIYNTWLSSGAGEDFIIWLRHYLASGGQNG